MHRRGKATSAKQKSLAPLKYGTDKTPMGFWHLLAEKVSIAPDGEKATDRGHRLEDEALMRLADELDLKMDLKPGFWESDIDEDIASSPDGAEQVDDTIGQLPTWAAEAKCLSSANHLKYVITDRRARKRPLYRAYDSIPNDKSASYREQALQYFVVNEKLETLYFVFYDDRISPEVEGYDFHYLTIKREDVADLVQAQKYHEIDTLVRVNKLIADMAEGKV
jgi:hypothetical protein